jgi:AcrR family transcriptional regulator
MDPRIERSQAALRHALLDLIKEKDYDAIGIQEIADRADTSRVTFYRHYANKEELLMDFLTVVYEDFSRKLDAEGPWNTMDFTRDPPSTHLFRFVQQDRLLYKRLVTGPMAPMLEQRMREHVVERINTFNEVMTVVEANFVASAVIGNLKWWLVSDSDYTPDAMAKMTHWLSVSGVQGMRGNMGRVNMPDADMRSGTIYADGA